MAVTLELAISAIRAGRKNEGRQLLNLLIQQNPNNEQAWLWMSAVVTTDEQRARCLYHVLSINPANALARRGLQLLGIVVSDSRPVRVPRDSQPIHIPNPSQPPALPATASPSTPVPVQNSPSAARRPFLINPQTITAELPFTPVREPFAAEKKIKPSPEILSLNVEEPDAPPAESQPSPADAAELPKTKAAQPEPELAAAATIGMPATTVAARAAAVEKPSADAVTENETVETSPPVTEVVTPAELDASAPPVAPPTAPLPVTAEASAEKPATTEAEAAIHSTQTQKMEVPAPDATAAPAETPATIEGQPLPSTAVPETPPDSPDNAAPVPPNPAAPPTPSRPVPVVASPPNAGAPPQPPAPDGVVPPPMETRPSQPIYVNYPDPNYGYPPNLGQMGGNPAFGAMPNQPPHQMPQPGQAFHSNATMGMPMPQYPQYRPPSEPVPVIQPNGQYGLITFGPPPYGQPGPGMNVHSNQTVLMPAMSEAEARARLEGTHQAIPTASAAAMPLQNNGWPEPQPWLAAMGQAQPAEDFEDEEEEPEMNVMAMIIFGTLSITAMGGLGMLVLLILTTPTT